MSFLRSLRMDAKSLADLNSFLRRHPMLGKKFWSRFHEIPRRLFLEIVITIKAYSSSISQLGIDPYPHWRLTTILAGIGAGGKRTKKFLPLWKRAIKMFFFLTSSSFAYFPAEREISLVVVVALWKKTSELCESKYGD